MMWTLADLGALRGLYEPQILKIIWRFKRHTGNGWVLDRTNVSYSDPAQSLLSERTADGTDSTKASNVKSIT